MKRSTGPILLSFLTVAAVFAGCSDDPEPQTFAPVGGSNTAAGTPATTAGTGGTPSAGSFNTAGTETGGTGGGGGETGGTAGTAGTAGTTAGTAGTAGTGGTPAVIVAAELLVDSVVVRLRGSTYGDADPSAGGAGGNGAGGEPSGAAGEAPVAAGGIGNDGGAGLGGAGVGGEGPVLPLPEFRYAYFFDATIEAWDMQSYGSTPNVGIDGGPEKLSRLSMQTWLGTDGEPANGAMLIKVPFSTKDEQLDIHKGFVEPHYEDWSEYEIVAKVKLTKGGDIGECLGAWIYVTTGTTYAFARGNLAAPLTVDDWTELEFDLSDPDPNSTPGGIPAAFNATEVGQMGIHIQSNACAP